MQSVGACEQNVVWESAVAFDGHRRRNHPKSLRYPEPHHVKLWREVAAIMRLTEGDTESFDSGNSQVNRTDGYALAFV